MRNTNAFKKAVAETLAELARRGVTVRAGTVADTIERNFRTVTGQLGSQERSVWRYFDAASIAEQRQKAESGAPGQVGREPIPSVDNPELALILGVCPMPGGERRRDLYSSSSTSPSTHGGQPHPRRGRLHRLPGQAADRHRMAGPNGRHHRGAARHHQVDPTGTSGRPPSTTPAGYGVTRT
ncbi:hypothetical protein [Streptomyces sp. 2132.2]|uniref:hypothetical protein n=1 Tax=Streptomyces sp. 2132.2 TaxID=2485161 RepID=UPI0016149371|nr:hypothetical protein [Streptomyces sp. 2132.2]